MNDRLKFRVWELGNNKYYFFDLEQGLSNAIEEMVNYKGIGTIEQSTGLKDKNGKLIFENDVVKIKSGYCGNSRIPTEEQIVIVEYDKFYYRHLCSSDIYEIEIIGNIH